MSNKLNSAEMQNLYKAILLLKTPEECDAFFTDLCTIKEMQDLSQRFDVCRLLDEGRNYQDISQMTGASTATISRVNKCLNYGSDGYRMILDRIKNQKEK